MGLKPIKISGNAFVNPDRFQIKGVFYSEGRGTQYAVIDLLADPSQCALDAPVLKALGANTISVPFVDPSLEHSECMKIFDNHGIYVLVNMAGSLNLRTEEWDMNFYRHYVSVVDSFAQYDNLLGFGVGSGIIDSPKLAGVVTSLKAAARDMKAYMAARKYRSIPIGYFGTDVSQIQTQVPNFLVCGGNSSEAMDFYALNLYRWCTGEDTMRNTGYDVLTSRFENLGVPLFLSEDGCTVPNLTREFTDQKAIWGDKMSDVWSGAVIYQWLQDDTNYGLVTYASSTLSGTPTPIDDYSNLKSQWATVTSNTKPPSTMKTPSCPALNKTIWTVDPTAPLPTVAGLNFATVKPAHSGTGIQTDPNSTPTTSTKHNAAADSGLSSGAKAGIGVGAALGVILILGLVGFLLWRRRRRIEETHAAPDKKPAWFKAELSGDGTQVVAPVELDGSGGQPMELPGNYSQESGPHELPSDNVHEAEVEAREGNGDHARLENEARNHRTERE